MAAVRFSRSLNNCELILEQNVYVDTAWNGDTTGPDTKRKPGLAKAILDYSLIHKSIPKSFLNKNIFLTLTVDFIHFGPKTARLKDMKSVGRVVSADIKDEFNLSVPVAYFTCSNSTE